MIKRISKLAIIACCMSLLFSCGNSSKDGKANAADSSTNTEVNPSESAPKEENAPSTTTFTIAPDTAILGKSSEALVKVTAATAVDLQDAEGKSTGAELTIKLLVTNKSKLDAKKFFSVSSSDARLELDNGTSITGKENSGSTSPEPEASSEAVWSFQIPANASPKKLNFFLDGTRVSVGFTKK